MNIDFKNEGYHLAQEQAVAIELNGITFAVMMMTPQDLKYFVVGFLFSEGIIERVIDVKDIEIVHETMPNAATSDINLGLSLKISLSNRSFHRFKERIRLLKGSSGCGICGSAALVQTFNQVNSINDEPDAFAFDANLLGAMREKVTEYQTLSAETGAMHGAFLLNSQAKIQASCEDIGRHNALDKLIGNILLNKLAYDKHAVLVTSRCGAELVQKIVCLGINTLISFASPSQLALQLANRAKLTLIHIPKKDSPIVYLPPTDELESRLTKTSKIKVSENA